LECGGRDTALDIDSYLRRYWKMTSIQNGVDAAALQILRPSLNSVVLQQPVRELNDRPDPE